MRRTSLLCSLTIEEGSEWVKRRRILFHNPSCSGFEREDSLTRNQDCQQEVLAIGKEVKLERAHGGCLGTKRR